MALCCRTQTHTLHTPLRLTLLPLTLVFQVPAGNASANDGAANLLPARTVAVCCRTQTVAVCQLPRVLQSQTVAACRLSLCAVGLRLSLCAADSDWCCVM